MQRPATATIRCDESQAHVGSHRLDRGGGGGGNRRRQRRACRVRKSAARSRGTLDPATSLCDPGRIHEHQEHQRADDHHAGDARTGGNRVEDDADSPTHRDTFRHG